jgi:hypothetical protein
MFFLGSIRFRWVRTLSKEIPATRKYKGTARREPRPYQYEDAAAQRPYHESREQFCDLARNIRNIVDSQWFKAVTEM